MNDLRTFAILQARVYEFLEQQDETTLRAIADGTAQLAVLHVDDAPLSSAPRDDVRTASRPATGLAMAPSDDPLQAAQDLSRLASEQERQLYLNATGLLVPGLKKVAKLLGIAGYSGLTRPKLINLLVGHAPVDGTSAAEQRATTQKARPSTGTPSTEPAKPIVDAAAIALRLRETETEEEGATYLNTQHLDRESLLAVAAELQLTRVDRLSHKDLTKRVLHQAIGARRKFAGLRKW